MYRLLDVIINPNLNPNPSVTPLPTILPGDHIDLSQNMLSLSLLLVVLVVLGFGFFSRKLFLEDKFYVESKSRKLILLAIGHLLIDLEGIYLIKSIYNDFALQEIVYYFVVYNFIAFATQVVFGYIADVKHLYVPFMVVGFILPLIAIQFESIGLFAIIISTTGNAMYHVGGGVLSMYLVPKKAAPAGLFVAPGAIGVFLGGYFALMEQSMTLWITLISIVVLVLLSITFLHHITEKEKHPIHNNFIQIIGLVMGVVLFRGLIGTTLIFPWKEDVLLLLVLSIGVFIGKLFGGILGDKFGYLRVGLLGLVTSLPFLILGYYFSILGVIGAVLFNLTMAITLYIIIDSLGLYKGFAFGLTTFALFISYLPSAFGLRWEMGLGYIFFLIISVVFAGIMFYKVNFIHQN